MKNKKVSAKAFPQSVITAVGKQPLVEISLKALDYVLARSGKRVLAKNISINTEHEYCTGSVVFEPGGEQPVNTVLFTDGGTKEDKVHCLERYSRAVLPFDACRKQDMEETLKEKITEYSHDDDRADLLAKNITQTQAYTSFELLGTGIIGRIKLKAESGLSVETALALAGALLSSGVLLKDVTDGLSAFEGFTNFA